MQVFRRGLIFSLMLIASYINGAAQQVRQGTTTATGSTLATKLPASDTVALVKVRRLLDEVLPAEPRRAGAERKTQRGLTSSRGRADHEQTRDVDARHHQ